VCPLSTVLRDAPSTRVPIEPTEANGLTQPSEIMADRITTVRRANIGGRVGVLTKQDMIRVEQSLLVFLGIAG
jgi:mRNA interferase MazF